MANDRRGRDPLIDYRSFLNTDPPALCELWKSHSEAPGIMQPMSVTLIESFVLAKPYFDRDGLIVATDDDALVGFIHAGFGPNTSRNGVSNDIGIICMLVVRDHPERSAIQRELILRAESYLRGRGAIELRAGGTYPNCPFYLGLYGGSHLPGILSADDQCGRAFREAGYDELERTVLFEKQIDSFRAPVDRTLVQHRRRMQVRPILSPAPRHWWDACVYGPTDQIRYLLEPKDGGAACGTVSFWDMGPLSTRQRSQSMGMIELLITEDQRRKGLATFLIAESLQHLAQSSVSLIHTQVARANEPCVNLLGKLGFEEVDYGVLFAK